MQQPKRHSPKASRDGSPRVHASASLRDTELGRFTDVAERCILHDCHLGDYSYCERDVQAIYTSIGKFCAIAAAARLNALNHPHERLSQHKFTYRPNEYFVGAKLDKVFRERRLSARVTIGHDVWIGHGAIILPGLTIGHGAIIGAGSVVTRDVDPFAIMAGVPARRIKWRFDKPVREAILALAWWDWDHDRLAAAVPDIQSLPITDFLAKYRSDKTA